MRNVLVELPTSVDEWASFDGVDLDDEVRELDTAGRCTEAAIVGATEHADRWVT